MKINCIIQARMGSTRLPGKTMARIGDKVLLDYVAERCSLAKECAHVIIAAHGFPQTVRHLQDSKRKDYTVVEGPEEPCARFMKVLAEYPCDGFVRVCADSPFIDPDTVNAVAWDVRSGMHFSERTTGVHGNIARGFLTKEFLRWEPLMNDYEREHLGEIFKKQARLTVDTPADLERARLIVSRMTKPHTEYTAQECLNLLRQ